MSELAVLLMISAFLFLFLEEKIDKILRRYNLKKGKEMKNLLSVKKTGQIGYSISGRCFFEAIFENEPTAQEVCEAQIKAGYHPSGYDGPWNISQSKTNDGKYLVKFSCSASCD